MHEFLSLLIYVVIFIIVFALMYWCGYSVWSSITFGILISLLALIVTFPWFFAEHHHRHEESCISSDEFERDTNFIFWGIVFISILILLAYIIGCIFDCNDSVAVIVNTPQETVIVT